MQIVNRTFDELHAGDTVSVERTLQPSDLRAWKAAFGDAEAAAVDVGEAAVGIVAAEFSALAGSALPGPGSSVRSMSVRPRRVLPLGEPVTFRLTVHETQPAARMVVLEGNCLDASGQAVATATLEVAAPAERIVRDLPEHRLEGLMERCRGLEPVMTGVVHP